MKRRLYVGNLAYSVTDEQLRNLFSRYGEVVDATVISDRMTGRSKGFGFVEMADDEGAQRAIEALHEASVAGRNLIVNEAREREASSPQGRARRWR